MMPGPGHAAFCGNEGPHERHRHPLPDSYEVCDGVAARPASHPGADWRDVQDGVYLTGAQHAARFLTLTQAEQIEFMQAMGNAKERAADCIMQNHFGAVWFARHHRCATPKASKRRQTIKNGRKP